MALGVLSSARSYRARGVAGLSIVSKGNTAVIQRDWLPTGVIAVATDMMETYADAGLIFAMQLNAETFLPRLLGETTRTQGRNRRYLTVWT